MLGRPEVLFPLFADLTDLEGVGARTASNLEGIDVRIPRDLLFSLPRSIVDRTPVSSLRNAEPSTVVTVEVRVERHVPGQGKGRPHKVEVAVGRDRLDIVFFSPRRNWVEQVLPLAGRRIVSGKLESFGNNMQIVHPDYVVETGDAEKIPKIEPVYPLASGLSQKLMVRLVQSVCARAPELPEWIAPERLRKHGWPDWRSAVIRSHAPRSAVDVAPDAPSRARLAYDELLAHQLSLALVRTRMRRIGGRSTVGDGTLAQSVNSGLPFSPTSAQRRAISEILSDMGASTRMNRLLQGDVGSGKTHVAFMALLNAVEAGGQGVMMAPTELLARQHYAKLKPLADTAGIQLEILTGRDRGTERSRKLSEIASGDIQVLLGTHAVFQGDVNFRDLRLAVVDEQHRFGVRQRMELAEKGSSADILVMAATPIPRSLALANYGDMDVSVLDEVPEGRQPVKTALISSRRLAEAIDRLWRAVERGRQGYWVCPLVEESESQSMTAAKERFEALKAVIGAEKVGLVHGQMPGAERDNVFEEFIRGRVRVLVATTVIEVGVDVPNATIMVIEHAENFGLAQLHQLRGRVGRGQEAASCLMIHGEPLNEDARQRLRTIRTTDDGFRIAETDLRMRGTGELLGVRQSGLPRFLLAEAWRFEELLMTAREDAQALLRDDPGLDSSRGEATQVLMHLMGAERSLRAISAD